MLRRWKSSKSYLLQSSNASAVFSTMIVLAGCCLLRMCDKVWWPFATVVIFYGLAISILCSTINFLAQLQLLFLKLCLLWSKYFTGRLSKPKQIKTTENWHLKPFSGSYNICSFAFNWDLVACFQLGNEWKNIYRQSSFLTSHFF